MCMHFCYVKRTCTYCATVPTSAYKWFPHSLYTPYDVLLHTTQRWNKSCEGFRNLGLSHDLFMREKIVQQCNHLLHATMSLLEKQ